MFDSCVMEIFKEHSICPSFFQLWDFVCWFHCNFAFAYSFWNT